MKISMYLLRQLLNRYDKEEISISKFLEELNNAASQSTEDTTKGDWKVIPHSYQIADTGDYDGHWEVTNGKVSLFTKDDPSDERLQDIANILNASECRFWINDRGDEADQAWSVVSKLQGELETYTRTEDTTEDVEALAEKILKAHFDEFTKDGDWITWDEAKEERAMIIPSMVEMYNKGAAQSKAKGEGLVPVEGYVDAWDWLSKNGERVYTDKGVSYLSSDILKALRMAVSPLAQNNTPVKEDWKEAYALWYADNYPVGFFETISWIETNLISKPLKP